MKRTVITLLKQAVEKFPKSDYLGEKTDNGWETKTFADTDLLSDYFAMGLIYKGFNTDDKIAILSEGRSKWVIGEFGILKARAVSVPLSIKLTPEEVLFRLNHSESKAILVSHNNIEKVISIIHNLHCEDFKLIYVDNDLGYVKALEDKYPNFDADKYLLPFDEVVEIAKHNKEELLPKLNDIVEQIDENDVVNISYTSGTTGNPKGIMLTHLNYYANSTASDKLFGIPPNSKMFCILPLDHSFAHTAGTFVGLIVPLAIYFLDMRGGGVAALKNIPINIKEVKPNVMFTVPSLSGSFMKNIISTIDKKGGFAKWLFHKGLNAGIAINGNGHKKASAAVRAAKEPIYRLADKLVFSKVRETFGGEIIFCVGGGALLDVKQQEFFYAIGMPIFQGYGLTEATPVISANTPKRHKLGSSGNVLGNIECKIVENGKELPTGVTGEIFIKGDSVMKGYFKNPEASAAVLRDGGLYTGDMAFYDEDNFLVVTGRAKALLISEDGEKYSPESIEETIAGSPCILNAMLYNDHSKYTTAIIDIDDNYIKYVINENKIQSAEKLLEYIDKALHKSLKSSEHSGLFQKKWLPTIFRIAPEHFTEENKMINSTMKMVRYKVTDYYKDLIDEMYLPNAKNDNTKNLKVLSKFFK